MKNMRTLLNIGGMALMAFGAVILFRPMAFTGWLSTLAGLILLATGILRWMEERGTTAWRDHPLLLIALGVILLINPHMPVRLAGIAMGLWAMVSGAGSLLSAWRLNRLAIAWQELALRGIFLLIVGALILMQPAIVSLAIGIPMGLVLMALGFYLVKRL